MAKKRERSCAAASRRSASSRSKTSGFSTKSGIRPRSSSSSFRNVPRLASTTTPDRVPSLLASGEGRDMGRFQIPRLAVPSSPGFARQLRPTRGRTATEQSRTLSSPPLPRSHHGHSHLVSHWSGFHFLSPSRTPEDERRLAPDNVVDECACGRFAGCQQFQLARCSPWRNDLDSEMGQLTHLMDRSLKECREIRYRFVEEPIECRSDIGLEAKYSPRSSLGRSARSAT